MAITEISLTIKVDGLEKLQKLVEMVGQFNKKPIEIKVDAGLPMKIENDITDLRKEISTMRMALTVTEEDRKKLDVFAESLLKSVPK